jgi:peptidylprolyl isomerase
MRISLAIIAVAGVLAGAVWFQTHPPDLDLSRGGTSDIKKADPGKNLPDISGTQWAPDERGLSGATAVLETAQGKIKFKFFTKDAPQTSRRIMNLIRQGFYDGQIFFRVVPGFAIQTGDPTATGNGGSGETLPAEPNGRRHTEGVVGLARGADPDSGDSQFYITLSPQPQLDGQYTIFGSITEGLEVTRKIQRGDRIIRLQLE